MSPQRSTGFLRVALGSVLLCAGLLSGLSSCRSSDTDDVQLRVTVDYTERGTWSATGSAVDGGLICADGTERAIGYVDTASGESIGQRAIDYRERQINEGANPDELVRYVMTAQWACADGSGTITVSQDGTTGGRWEVVDGTGAYVGLRGGGTLTMTRNPFPESPEDDEATDLSLTADRPGALLVVELTGDIYAAQEVEAGSPD